MINLVYESIFGEKSKISLTNFKIVYNFDINTDPKLDLETLQEKIINRYADLNFILLSAPYFNRSRFQKFIESDELKLPLNMSNYFISLENSHIDSRINLVGLILENNNDFNNDFNFDLLLKTIAKNQEILGLYNLENKLIGYNFTFK